MVLLYLLCLSTSVSAAIIPAYHEESPTCGTVAESLREPRIVGGREVFQGEVPWIVSLQSNGTHFCGGSIIDKRHILTAAHCFDSNGHDIDLTWIKVVVGAHRRSNIDLIRTTEMDIKKLKKHDDYISMAHYDNDIAILELSEDIKWSNYVKPICLPKTDVPAGSWATVSGWGEMLGDSKHKARQAGSNSNNAVPQAFYSDALMAVNLTIFENSFCNELYRSCNSTLTLTNTQICAGTVPGPDGNDIDDKDAAQGDSGGPLAVLINGRWTVAAIVSVKPSKFKAPAIYSRVSSYIKWIQKTIQD